MRKETAQSVPPVGLGRVCLRTLCDVVAGGALGAIGAFFCYETLANGSFPISVQAYCAAVFFGALTLLLFRSPSARKTAMLSNVVAVVALVVLQWQLFSVDAARQLAWIVYALSVLPLAALVFLLADHYLVACRVSPAHAGDRDRVEARLSRAASLVVCALTLAGSIGVFAYIGAPMVTQLRSLAWPTTEGRVVGAEIVPRADTVGCWGGCAAGSRLEIEYTYLVEGVQRTGRRIHAFDQEVMRYSTNWMERFILDSPAGTVLPVAYNPSSPARAVVRRGVDGWQAVMLLAVMWCFTFFLTLFWSRTRLEYLLLNGESHEGSPPFGEQEMPVLLVFGLASYIASRWCLAVTDEPDLCDAAIAWGISIGVAVTCWLYFRQKSERERTSAVELASV